MRRRKLSCAAALLLAVLAAWFIREIRTGDIPAAIGHWLYVREPLEKSDAVYVYAGGILERPAYGARLYREGYAPLVIVGGVLMDANLFAIGAFVNDGTLNRAAVVKRGVPEKNVDQIWDGTSTYDETLALKRYMLERGLDSAILVTSPFHTRRVRLCADRVFKGTGIKTTVAAARYPVINLERWWEDERDLLTIIIEYFKLLFYLTKYR